MIKLGMGEDTMTFKCVRQSLEVKVGSLTVANHRPITVIAGVNVLDTARVNLLVAETLVKACDARGIPLVFKASFDKANRSSYTSPRGPGLKKGIHQLRGLKERFAFPIVTDIHVPEQANEVAEYIDLIQIPAFLCRQTDLIQAACDTGRPLHIKKMQNMSPSEALLIQEKCAAFGSTDVILCERGSAFGYQRLVVDPLSMYELQTHKAPVSFDVTHALQCPGGANGQTSGRGGALTLPLARAGTSIGIAALFFECHPEPTQALCDGASALPLHLVDQLLDEIQAIDRLVKSM